MPMAARPRGGAQKAAKRPRQSLVVRRRRRGNGLGASTSLNSLIFGSNTSGIARVTSERKLQIPVSRHCRQSRRRISEYSARVLDCTSTLAGADADWVAMAVRPGVCRWALGCGRSRRSANGSLASSRVTDPETTLPGADETR